MFNSVTFNARIHLWKKAPLRLKLTTKLMYERRNLESMLSVLLSDTDQKLKDNIDNISIKSKCLGDMSVSIHFSLKTSISYEDYLFLIGKAFFLLEQGRNILATAFSPNIADFNKLNNSGKLAVFITSQDNPELHNALIENIVKELTEDERATYEENIRAGENVVGEYFDMLREAFAGRQREEFLELRGTLDNKG